MNGAAIRTLDLSYNDLQREGCAAIAARNPA